MTSSHVSKQMLTKERAIIKMQEDEQRLRDLQNRIIKQEEIKAPTAEALQAVQESVEETGGRGTWYGTKKSVLNSPIKKMKVDQNGLVEIDFCAALSHTPYMSYLLPRFQ